MREQITLEEMKALRELEKMKKERKNKRRKIIGASIGLLLFPFILIVFLVIGINFFVILSQLLPANVIIIKIEQNGLMSFENFILYYVTVLGVVVTGVLSYAIYKLSVNKTKNEIEDKRIKNRLRYLETLNKVYYILEGLYNNYIKINNSKWSFVEIIEKNPRDQYSYGKSGMNFATDEWKLIRAKVTVVLLEMISKDLDKELNEIFDLFESISKCSDVNQLEIKDYVGFEMKVKKALFHELGGRIRFLAN